MIESPKLDCYRLDFRVAHTVVVELESIETIPPIHEAIVLTYLRLSGRRLGLLLNFNVVVLKNGIRRYALWIAPFKAGPQR